MIDFKNKKFKGSNERWSVFDCTIKPSNKAVVIFVHGYKGFKDWGAWGLMSESFVNQEIGVVKFNMSHNGGTTENPIDFDDLDAFGQNRYSWELNDLKIIIEETYRLIHDEMNLDIPIVLLGHSRGGGVCILEGANNEKVDGIISLAGISDIASRFPEGDELNEWKVEGIKTVWNGRTEQEMPHYFSFYEDFIENKDRLDIENACRTLNKPFVQIHGDMDMSVSVSEGLAIANWTETEVKIIKGTEHTFGSNHPWKSDQLPEELNEVVDFTVDWINTQIVQS
ncbi:MAG: alpha/beta hydrolase [Crocinitomicaceae bacterium]